MQLKGYDSVYLRMSFNVMLSFISIVISVEPFSNVYPLPALTGLILVPLCGLNVTQAESEDQLISQTMFPLARSPLIFPLLHLAGRAGSTNISSCCDCSSISLTAAEKPMFASIWKGAARKSLHITGPIRRQSLCNVKKLFISDVAPMVSSTFNAVSPISIRAKVHAIFAIPQLDCSERPISKRCFSALTNAGYK